MSVYNITRWEAAVLMGVSIRTIDRYTLKWALKFKKIGWKVYFDKEAVNKLKVENNIEYVDTIKPNTTFRTSTASVVKEESSADIIRLTWERDMFKLLYDDAYIKLKEKDEKMEALSLRIGEIKSSETAYMFENIRNHEMILTLNEKLGLNKKIINSLENELYMQNLVKRVYFGWTVLVFLSIMAFYYYYFNL